MGLKLGYILPQARALALEFEWNYMFQQNIPAQVISGCHGIGQCLPEQFPGQPHPAVSRGEDSSLCRRRYRGIFHEYPEYGSVRRQRGELSPMRPRRICLAASCRSQYRSCPEPLRRSAVPLLRHEPFIYRDQCGLQNASGDGWDSTSTSSRRLEDRGSRVRGWAMIPSVLTPRSSNLPSEPQ